MPIKGLSSGIDIIEIARIQAAIQRHGQRLLERIFSPLELSEVKESPPSLAARFAAKEAVAKALGTGIGIIGWQEIEILRGPNGQPQLRLSGAAANLAAQMKLNRWSVSLSHTHTHAVAVVVAMEES